MLIKDTQKLRNKYRLVLSAKQAAVLMPSVAYLCTGSDTPFAAWGVSDFPCMACSSQSAIVAFKMPCVTDGIRHLHEVRCLPSLHLIHGKSDTLLA